MKLYILLIVFICALSHKESLTDIAINLESMMNCINPTEFSFTLEKSLLKYTVKNITNIITYTKREIIIFDDLPTIRYDDFQVNMYFYFIIEPITNKKRIPQLQMFKKGLHATLFFKYFLLKQMPDNSLYLSLPLYPYSKEMDLGELNEFFLFKEIYEDDGQILLGNLITSFEMNMVDILTKYPKGKYKFLFESMIQYMSQNEFMITCCEGKIERGKITKVSYEISEKSVNKEIFHNVNLTVRYGSTSNMVYSFMKVSFISISDTAPSFGVFEPQDKISIDIIDEIFNKAYHFCSNND